MFDHKRKVQNLQKNDRVYIGSACLRVTKIKTFKDPKKDKMVGVKGKLIDNDFNVLGSGGFIVPKNTEISYYPEFRL